MPMKTGSRELLSKTRYLFFLKDNEWLYAAKRVRVLMYLIEKINKEITV